MNPTLTSSEPVLFFGFRLIIDMAQLKTPHVIVLGPPTQFEKRVGEHVLIAGIQTKISFLQILCTKVYTLVMIHRKIKIIGKFTCYLAFNIGEGDIWCWIGVKIDSCDASKEAI